MPGKKHKPRAGSQIWSSVIDIGDCGRLRECYRSPRRDGCMARANSLPPTCTRLNTNATEYIINHLGAAKDLRQSCAARGADRSGAATLLCAVPRIVA